MTASAKIPEDPVVIVELAVDDRVDRAVFIRQRLRASRDVEDREPSVTEGDAAVV
jgi:hypothetical protein